MRGLATWLVWSTVETADDEVSTFTYVDATSEKAACLGVLADGPEGARRSMIVEPHFVGLHEKREARERYQPTVTWRLEATAVSP